MRKEVGRGGEEGEMERKIKEERMEQVKTVLSSLSRFPEINGVVFHRPPLPSSLPPLPVEIPSSFSSSQNCLDVVRGGFEEWAQTQQQNNQQYQQHYLSSPISGDVGLSLLSFALSLSSLSIFHAGFVFDKIVEQLEGICDSSSPPLPLDRLNTLFSPVFLLWSGEKIGEETKKDTTLVDNFVDWLLMEERLGHFVQILLRLFEISGASTGFFFFLFFFFFSFFFSFFFLCFCFILYISRTIEPSLSLFPQFQKKKENSIYIYYIAINH